MSFRWLFVACWIGVVDTVLWAVVNRFPMESLGASDCLKQGGALGIYWMRKRLVVLNDCDYQVWTMANDRDTIAWENRSFAMKKRMSVTTAKPFTWTMSIRFTRPVRGSLQIRKQLPQLWKIRFIIVEKLSKRCCIRFRLLYKYVIGCCSFAETDPTATTLVCLWHDV